MAKSPGASLREYGRGIAGGLLFSLPLLYTMEIWWTGFIASPGRLLVFMGSTFLLLLGYNRYAGLRHAEHFGEVVAESVEEIGLGLLLSGAILWLTSRIGSGMSTREILGKTVVESMIVAIGISVGKTQLAGKDPGDGDTDQGQDGNGREPQFLGQFVLGLCGAALLATNVAPTGEIVVIAIESSALQVLLVLLVSLALGAGVLYYSDFRGSRRWVRRPDHPADVAAGAVMTYAAALITSGFMLWFFGRFSGLATPTILRETVVLALPAVLGASAGRLLLQV